MMTRKELEGLLNTVLRKPWKDRAEGPEAFDCMGLVRYVMDRMGVKVPDFRDQHPDDVKNSLIELEYPRPWSMVFFKETCKYGPHVGIVLPDDNMFLHALEDRGVQVDRLTDRYWEHRGILGYYWPKGVVSVEWMHSPISKFDTRWMFYQGASRNLNDIILSTGYPVDQITLDVWHNRQKVEREQWPSVSLSELDSLIIRPSLGKGQEGQMMAMVGLMMLAWWAGPAVAGAMGYAATGATAGSYAAVAAITQGIIVGAGGYLVSSALAPKKDDLPKNDQAPGYSWNPGTTQRTGVMPLCYGRLQVQGNVVANWTEYTYTIGSLKGETRYTQYRDRCSAQLVSGSLKATHTAVIALGQGPFHSIDPDGDTETIQETPADSFEGVTVTHRTGTSNQTAVLDNYYFELAFGKNLELNTPVEIEIPDKNISGLRFQISAPQGLYHINEGEDKTTLAGGQYGLEIAIKEDSGSWQILFDDQICAATLAPCVWVVDSATQYFVPSYYDRVPNNPKWQYDVRHGHQAPVSITPGHQYTARFTVKSTHTYEYYRAGMWVIADSTCLPVQITDGVNLCPIMLLAVQEKYPYSLTMPGVAYTVVEALAQEDLNSSLQYAVDCECREVEVYSGGTWTRQFSQNHAWIARDVFCMPRWDEATGTVEAYEGADPDLLDLTDLVSLAAWVEEQADDGRGGLENQFQFDGGFYTPEKLWVQFLKVLEACRASCYWDGNKCRIVIDRAALPCDLFTLSNQEAEGFSLVRETDRPRATEVQVTFLNSKAGFASQWIAYSDRTKTNRIVSQIDGFGTTRDSEAWRRAYAQVLKNKYINYSMTVPLLLDGRYRKPNDVVSIQHRTLSNGTPGRVTARTEETPTVSITIPVTVTATDKYLKIRTWDDAGAQHIDIYEISDTSDDGKVLGLTTVWETGRVPEVDDVVWFGSITELTKMMRINSITRDSVYGMRVSGYEYVSEAYGVPTSTLIEEAINQIRHRRGVKVAKSYLNDQMIRETIRRGDTQSDYADVTKDTAVELFDETFDDVRYIDDIWIHEAGAGECSIITGGEAGSLILEVGDDDGTDYEMRYYFKSFAFDPKASYRMRVRVRCTAGDGLVYFGLGGRNADDDEWVNIYGLNSLDDQHWVCAYAESVGADWVEFVGYIKGLNDTDSASIGTEIASHDPNHPAKMHYNVKYVRPIWAVNVSGDSGGDSGGDTAGITDIDSIIIERLPSSIDDTADGVKYVKDFHEYFEDLTGDVLSRWHDWNGVTNLDITAGGYSGGKFLRCGDNDGDDGAWLIYNRSFPYEPGWLWRIQCRVRRTSGSGKVYIGVVGRNGADDAYVNVSGLDTRASQHYVCASGYEPDSDWEVLTGYFSGFGTPTGDAVPRDVPGDPANPCVLHSSVRWIRPAIYVNWENPNGTSGITDIDMFTMDVVSKEIVEPYETKTFSLGYDGESWDEDSFPGPVLSEEYATEILSISHRTYGSSPYLDFQLQEEETSGTTTNLFTVVEQSTSTWTTVGVDDSGTNLEHTEIAAGSSINFLTGTDAAGGEDPPTAIRITIKFRKA